MKSRLITTALAALMAVSAATTSMADPAYRGHDDRYYQSNIDRRVETYKELGRTNPNDSSARYERTTRRNTGQNFGTFLGGLAIGAVAGAIIAD